VSVVPSIASTACTYSGLKLRWGTAVAASTACQLGRGGGHRRAGRGRAGGRVVRLAGLPRNRVFASGDLLQLVALVAAAGRVVSGDTGVAHLATALRKPSVVLFGPVSPRLWGPPEDARHLVLWAGRTGDPHAGPPDAGLLEITPEQVLQALLAAGGQLAGGLTGIRLSLPRRSAGACR